MESSGTERLSVIGIGYLERKRKRYQSVNLALFPSTSIFSWSKNQIRTLLAVRCSCVAVDDKVAADSLNAADTAASTGRSSRLIEHDCSGRRVACGVIESSNARNSLDGLHRQPPADLPFSRPPLAPVAIPVTTATFQGTPPGRAEFCALNPRFRDRSSRDVAHSDRDCDLGATATCRVIELD